jgi:hypothetical protein
VGLGEAQLLGQLLADLHHSSPQVQVWQLSVTAVERFYVRNVGENGQTIFLHCRALTGLAGGVAPLFFEPSKQKHPPEASPVPGAW